MVRVDPPTQVAVAQAVGRADRAVLGPADLATTVPADPAGAPADLVTTDPGALVDLAVPVTTDLAGLATSGPGDHGPGGPGGPGGWHGDDHRGYFHGAPWGDGPAPWGAGEPPHPNWGRPLPPPGGRWNDGPINYYGYNENPIWNPGFNQWGFDFFGVWIPL